MICLGYYSSATEVMNPEKLGDIVASAREKNAACGVTGMLCHFDGSFLQFLEGEDDSVSEIFEAISRDRRHKGILQVYRQPISERLFGEWSMAVVQADEVGPAQKAFARSLRQVELAGDAAHRQALEPFLDSFRSWIR